MYKVKVVFTTLISCKLKENLSHMFNDCIWIIITWILSWIKNYFLFFVACYGELQKRRGGVDSSYKVVFHLRWKYKNKKKENKIALFRLLSEFIAIDIGIKFIIIIALAWLSELRNTGTYSEWLECIKNILILNIGLY